MSSRLRLSATTFLVALLTATALAFTSGTADAAAKKDTFRAPDRHVLAASHCEKVGEDKWRVTFKWRVRGGRYQNLGNMENFKDKRDVVWRGGRRIVKTSVTIVPWGDGPMDPPESATATYNHLVAPIDDRSEWVSLTDKREVNLDCK